MIIVYVYKNHNRPKSALSYRCYRWHTDVTHARLPPHIHPLPPTSSAEAYTETDDVNMHLFLRRIALSSRSLARTHPDETEAESKEKHGVCRSWIYLTLCRLQSWLKHIYHGKHYARVDLNPMPRVDFFPPVRDLGFGLWFGFIGGQKVIANVSGLCIKYLLYILLYMDYRTQ